MPAGIPSSGCGEVGNYSQQKAHLCNSTAGRQPWEERVLGPGAVGSGSSPAGLPAPPEAGETLISRKVRLPRKPEQSPSS